MINTSGKKISLLVLIRKIIFHNNKNKKQIVLIILRRILNIDTGKKLLLYVSFGIVGVIMSITLIINGYDNIFTNLFAFISASGFIWAPVQHASINRSANRKGICWV